MYGILHTCVCSPLLNDGGTVVLDIYTWYLFMLLIYKSSHGSTSLFKYFNSSKSLPTVKDKSMSETITGEVNVAVSGALTWTEQSTSQKRKGYSVFSDE